MRRSYLVVLMLVGIVGLLGSVPASAEDGEHAYIGSKGCKKCHLKQYKSWEQTTMATTFDALKPGERAEAKAAGGFELDKDYTADPECVKCHVTGYGEEGGFVDIETTPELAGVGCEACHGAGGTYTQDHLMSLKNKEYKKAEVVAAGLVEAISADQCVSCHSAENPAVADDFVFDFEANKDSGNHEHFPLKYAHE